MALVSKYAYHNFSAGEASPLVVESRSDLAKYKSMARTMENFITIPWGAAETRNGTQVIESTKDSTKLAIVRRFEFSTTQAYILEFGDLYIRVYRNHGQILSSGTPVEIVSPYEEANLLALDFEQSADTLYIAGAGDYVPKKLTRSSHTSWTLSTISFTVNPFTSSGNYPRAVGFHEERLYWGGTDNDPQKLWGSQSGDFENLDPGTGSDNEAVIFTIAGGQVNAIRGFISGRDFFIFTVGGEWKLTGGLSDPITPTNVDAKKQSSHGSNNVQHVEAEEAAIFITPTGRKVRHLIYNFERDGYKSPDLSLLAEHITEGGIVDAAYQQEPNSIIWMVRDDGVLVSMTYLPEQNVVAFARHITDGSFESVAVIPAPDQSCDEVWVTVKRQTDNGGVRFVEYFNHEFYLDSALSYSGPLTDTFSGLTHLWGKEVSIIGGGSVFPSQIVPSTGIISISKKVATATIGLPYSPKLIPSRPDVQLEGGGVSLGKEMSFGKISLVLYKTEGLTVNGDTVPFRKSDDPMDTATEPFTGIKEVQGLDWNKDPQTIIEQKIPKRATVLGIMGELVIAEN